MKHSTNIHTVIYSIWTVKFDTTLLSHFLEVTQLVTDGWALNNKTFTDDLQCTGCCAKSFKCGFSFVFFLALNVSLLIATLCHSLISKVWKLRQGQVKQLT